MNLLCCHWALLRSGRECRKKEEIFARISIRWSTIEGSTATIDDGRSEKGAETPTLDSDRRWKSAGSGKRCAILLSPAPICCQAGANCLDFPDCVVSIGLPFR